MSTTNNQAYAGKPEPTTFGVRFMDEPLHMSDASEKVSGHARKTRQLCDWCRLLLTRARTKMPELVG
jgi:hypothetical protein